MIDRAHHSLLFHLTALLLCSAVSPQASAQTLPESTWEEVFPPQLISLERSRLDIDTVDPFRDSNGIPVHVSNAEYQSSDGFLTIWFTVADSAYAGHRGVPEDHAGLLLDPELELQPERIAALESSLQGDFGVYVDPAGEDSGVSTAYVPLGGFGLVKVMSGASALPRVLASLDLEAFDRAAEGLAEQGIRPALWSLLSSAPDAFEGRPVESYNIMTDDTEGAITAFLTYGGVEVSTTGPSATVLLVSAEPVLFERLLPGNVSEAINRGLGEGTVTATELAGFPAYRIDDDPAIAVLVTDRAHAVFYTFDATAATSQELAARLDEARIASFFDEVARFAQSSGVSVADSECAAEACFEAALATCRPARLRAETGEVVAEYVMTDESPEGCVVSLTFHRNPNPEWEGKPLLFLVPRGSSFQEGVMQALNRCRESPETCFGPLLEVIGG